MSLASRELCILVAFHAILNDTEEYERLDGLSCEDSTAEHAVRYGEALWKRVNPQPDTDCRNHEHP